MTQYLTAEQVLFIHARLIDETGGEHGLRYLGVLQAATARPRATFDGKELYPDLFQKAAALMQSLVNGHPFLDGNKRTGITAAGIFLQLNGIKLKSDDQTIVKFTMEVAQSQHDIDAITAWLCQETASQKD